MTFTLIETQPPASNRGGEGLGVGVFGGEWEGGGGKLGDSLSFPIPFWGDGGRGGRGEGGEEWLLGLIQMSLF